MTQETVFTGLTTTLPAGVMAASGMDVVCHARESWTARPFDSRARKAPGQRVPAPAATISDDDLADILSASLEPW